MPTYPCYDINVLESWEAIRKRPSMYADLADPALPVTLVRNAIRAARELGAAGAQKFKIEAFAGGVIAVSDDGIGWDSTPVNGVPRAASLLREPAQASMQASNLAVVTLVALSHEFRLTTHHAGRVWSQQFLGGQAITPYEDQGPSTRTGSLMTLTLDKALLPRVEFEAAPLRALAEELRASGHQVELQEP